MSLKALFNPRSIALIGASHSEEKLGGVILKNLLKSKARIYPINPNYPSLMGLRSYASIEELPETVDISIIMRPAEEMPNILKTHKGRAHFVVIMSSGYSEVGHDALQDEVKRLGKEMNLRILGPNCMGVYDPYERLDMLFLPEGRVKRPKKGNVSIVTQSGAVLHCFFGMMRASNIGISKAVTYGNAVDIDESEIYEYLSEDKRTAVVVSYIESVGDGRRFLEKASLLSSKKSLLVLKAGKGESGERAAFSHTGRLAGRYEVFSSLLRQFGIKEVMDFDEMVDSVKALSLQRPLKGNRILIVTNGGGSGVLASDECLRQGLSLPPLPTEKAVSLRKEFPSFYGIGNPFDLTAQVKGYEYLTVLEALKDDYDGFVVIALAGVTGITEELAGMLKEFREKTLKPLVVHTTCGCGEGRLVPLLETAGIPVYQSAERAVRAMRFLLR